MDFGLAWTILPLALAFGLGWLASRIDRWQTGREPREAPRAYFKGLTFLLNEQQDKAIDSFIEAVRLDPQTVELQFALGNLFRRRGEYERSVRVHQSLVERADLPAAERERAQYELACDFLKAGLLDRAEQAFAQLTKGHYAPEALQSQLQIAERTKDWPAAIEAAAALEQRGAGAYGRWAAQYRCELAEAAHARGQHDEAQAQLDAALAAHAGCVRAVLLRGDWQAAAGQWADAVATWLTVDAVAPEFLPLAAQRLARVPSDVAQRCQVRERLAQWLERQPGSDVLEARIAQARDDDDRRAVSEGYLARHQTLAAARRALALSPSSAPVQQAALAAIDQALLTRQRFRCASCGFEVRQYFWQCPGCMGWETYPPRRMEEQ
ncbi:MAG: lipopolysaccharide assembly protein LapB [Betaproteobacteria bacterium]|nr:lipopolysaccharide assembly protein LapB [Betaproteobacteria bacterium]MDE2047513.1 lipopolysaccharide assembly protein LapB [Betaproteobacteria bacterium]